MDDAPLPQTSDSTPQRVGGTGNITAGGGYKHPSTCSGTEITEAEFMQSTQTEKNIITSSSNRVTSSERLNQDTCSLSSLQFLPILAPPYLQKR